MFGPFDTISCNQSPITENIIYLPGQPGDVLFIRSEFAERMMLMSTYEEFMIILTVALLIVAILEHSAVQLDYAPLHLARVLRTIQK